MNCPLTFDENGALFFCKTKEDAEKYLEVEDIQENEYIAYDSEGRLLALKIVDTTKPSFLGLTHRVQQKVIVECAENTPNHCDELRNKLLIFLTKIAPDMDANSDVTLKELLDLVIKKSGYCM